MAASIETAHRLPIPEQVVAVPWLHDSARRGREVFPQALRQVL